MRYQLTQRGYKVVEVEGWQQHSYDVITCLNVLDRCDNPVALLQVTNPPVPWAGISRVFQILMSRPR